MQHIHHVISLTATVLEQLTLDNIKKGPTFPLRQEQLPASSCSWRNSVSRRNGIHDRDRGRACA